MGIAAYNRGSKALSERITMEQRDQMFVFMEDLNAIPKHDDCGRPFKDVEIVQSRGVWWIECSSSGYGFYYKNLRELMRRWDVTIHSFIDGKFLASPNK